MSGSSASKKEHQAQYNENRKRKREALKTPVYLFEISVPDGDDERPTKIKELLRNVKDVMCIDGIFHPKILHDMAMPFVSQWSAPTITYLKGYSSQNTSKVDMKDLTHF